MACGSCWVLPMAPRSATSSSRWSGGSNGAFPVLIDPAVRTSVPIMLRHTSMRAPDNFIFLTQQCIDMASEAAAGREAAAAADIKAARFIKATKQRNCGKNS